MSRAWISSVAALICLGGLAPFTGRAQSSSAAVRSVPSLDDTLTHVARYVHDYFAQAQSLVVTEAVTVQPIDRQMASTGFARHLLYELHVEWQPPDGDTPGKASAVRELLKVSGPTFGDRKGNDCYDPPPISPEPLAFLLPGNHEDVIFVSSRSARIGQTPALTVDYKSAPTTEQPSSVWDGDCGSMNIPGRATGRVWIDPESHAVLRLEESLRGPVDVPLPPKHRQFKAPYFTVERLQTSIHYKRVTFQNPDAELLLPDAITTVSMTTGEVTSRIRLTREFSNYRRFVTGSRMVVD